MEGIVTDQLSVLLVEDDPVNKMVIEKYMNNLNVSPDNAVNDKESLAYLSQKTYDLVILDLHGEGLNGKEIAYRLRNEHQKTKIVVSTAWLSEKEKEELDEIGVHGYLIKPFDQTELREVMETI